jgi:hypothetical protein
MKKNYNLNGEFRKIEENTKPKVLKPIIEYSGYHPAHITTVLAI